MSSRLCDLFIKNWSKFSQINRESTKLKESSKKIFIYQIRFTLNFH